MSDIESRKALRDMGTAFDQLVNERDKRIAELEAENGEYFTRLEVLKAECKSLNGQRDALKADLERVTAEKNRTRLTLRREMQGEMDKVKAQLAEAISRTVDIRRELLDHPYGMDEWSTPVVNLQTLADYLSKAIVKGGDA